MNDRINVYQKHVEKRYREIERRKRNWYQYLKEAKRWGYRYTHYQKKPEYRKLIFSVTPTEEI